MVVEWMVVKRMVEWEAKKKWILFLQLQAQALPGIAGVTASPATNKEGNQATNQQIDQ